MTEKDVAGPARAELEIPTGIYMGAVMMNRDTFELVDVSARGTAGRLVCQVPKGNWKVMAFFLTEGKARVVEAQRLVRRPPPAMMRRSLTQWPWTNSPWGSTSRFRPAPCSPSAPS